MLEENIVTNFVFAFWGKKQLEISQVAKLHFDLHVKYINNNINYFKPYWYFTIFRILQVRKTNVCGK